MHFKSPLGDVSFEIPDEWWFFAEMEGFASVVGKYYPYAQTINTINVIPISEIEPPQRCVGLPPFKKCKLVPVLLAFRSPECALPPVEVYEISGDQYHYKVSNGYHRYYGSVAAGFTHLPVITVVHHLN